jgi:hypothetical protein
MRILTVLTSHDRLGVTGAQTGFWLEELAAPGIRSKSGLVRAGGERGPRADSSAPLNISTRRSRTTMKLSDERLEQIRAWLCGESPIDPSVKPEEMAAMANELRQLRLRTSTLSRSALAPSEV